LYSVRIGNDKINKDTKANLMNNDVSNELSSYRRIYHTKVLSLSTKKDYS